MLGAGWWGAVVHLNEVMQTTVPDGASFCMHNRVPFGAQKTTTNRPPREYTHQCRLHTPLKVVVAPLQKCRFPCGSGSTPTREKHPP